MADETKAAPWEIPGADNPAPEPAEVPARNRAEYPKFSRPFVEGIASIMGACASEPGVLSILNNPSESSVAAQMSVATQKAALLFSKKSGVDYPVAFAVSGQLVGKSWSVERKIPSPEQVADAIGVFAETIGDADYHPYNAHLSILRDPRNFGDRYRVLWDGFRGLSQAEQQGERDDEWMSVFLSRLSGFSPRAVGEAFGDAERWTTAQLREGGGKVYPWPEIALLDDGSDKRNLRLGLATQIARSINMYEKASRTSPDYAMAAFGERGLFLNRCARAAIGCANAVETVPEWAQGALRESHDAAMAMMTAMREGMDSWHRMQAAIAANLYKYAEWLSEKTGESIGSSALKVADLAKCDSEDARSAAIKFSVFREKAVKSAKTRKEDVFDVLSNPEFAWNGSSSISACIAINRRAHIVRGFSPLYQNPWGSADDRLSAIRNVDTMVQNANEKLGMMVGDYRSDHEWANAMWGRISNSVMEGALPGIVKFFNEPSNADDVNTGDS